MNYRFKQLQNIEQQKEGNIWMTDKMLPVLFQGGESLAVQLGKTWSPLCTSNAADWYQITHLTSSKGIVSIRSSIVEVRSSSRAFAYITIRFLNGARINWSINSIMINNIYNTMSTRKQGNCRLTYMHCVPPNSDATHCLLSPLSYTTLSMVLPPPRETHWSQQRGCLRQESCPIGNA